MDISQLIRNLVVGENAGPRPKFTFKDEEYHKHSNHFNAGRRSSSPRIKQIIHTSRLTIADIARIYAQRRLSITKSNKELIAQNQAINYESKPVIDSLAVKINLLKTVYGQKNSPAYCRVIEECWKLPIAEIRAIYREDRERQAAGNPMTREELDNFSKYYRAHWQGITVEEYEAQRQEILRNLQGLALSGAEGVAA